MRLASALLVAAVLAGTDDNEGPLTPLFVTVDLDRNASEPVKVRSDGNAKPQDPNGYAETVHRFARAGHYLVRVDGAGHGGLKATAHLQVRFAEKVPVKPED
jgi:hypothetical protein